MADPYDDDDSDKPESKSDKADNTELLPIGFFPETPEPGKVCKIRVEEVYDDQASVSYVHDSDKKDEDAYDDESPRPERGTISEIEEMFS